MMTIKMEFLMRQKLMMTFNFWSQVIYNHEQKESFKNLIGKNKKT